MPITHFNIVIVNYNGGRLLAKTLAALQDQTFQNFFVTVVDNGSTDGSLECLGCLDDRFCFLKLTRNIGFAAASNLGANYKLSNWIVTLNPDAIPLNDWLEQIVTAQKEHPSIHVFGSTQISLDNSLVIDGFGDSLSVYGIAWQNLKNKCVKALPNNNEIVFSPCGAAAVYRSDTFMSFGGFAANFFCYLEDVDLGWRMKRAGTTCLQLRHAIVLHKGSYSYGSDSEFCLFHSHRNRILMMKRNLPMPLFIVFSILGSMAYLPTIIFRYPFKGKVAALKGILYGYLLSCSEGRISQSSAMKDFLILFYQGKITASFLKIMTKDLI